jgi:hypothetical protein
MLGAAHRSVTLQVSIEELRVHLDRIAYMHSIITSWGFGTLLHAAASRAKSYGQSLFARKLITALYSVDITGS